VHIDNNTKNKNITESLTSGIEIHQYAGNGEVTEEAPRIRRGLVVIKAKKTNTTAATAPHYVTRSHCCQRKTHH